ncbi:MAG TPA: peptidase [Intrasporangiaceae bacterium]|nr:peptidase [Intrasporangiaceae bacterium]
MRLPLHARKVAAVVGGALLAASLTACSGSDEPAPTTPAAPTAEPGTDAPDAGATAEPAPTTPGATADDSTDDDAAGGDPETFTAQPGRDIDLRRQQFPITPQDAIGVAVDTAGVSEIVYSIELDHSDTHDWKWEVKILDGTTKHDVEIDAVSGAVIKHETDTTNDTKKPIDLTAPLPLGEAMDLALAERDGTVGEWKLESDDSRVAYQFDITVDGQEREVVVDVETKEARVK